MQDLTEAYLSVYGNIEEYKTPYTRRSLGKESQFVPKTGEEKTNEKIKSLKSTHNLPDNKRAKRLERLRDLVADKEAAEASREAHIKMRQREKRERRNMREGRAFPGGPDLAHKFPLSDEEKKSAQNLGFAAKAKAEKKAEASETKSASKPKKKKLEFEVRENVYDIVLDYLLDEGYADTEENAISMMSAMSEDWIDSIVEAFVDPENDEAPSGRTPMQNIEDKSDKVRKKAIKGFENQMGKEYGGKWKYQER